MTTPLKPVPGTPPFTMGGETILVPEMPLAVCKRVRLALKAWATAPAEERDEEPAWEVIAAMVSGLMPDITAEQVGARMTGPEFRKWVKASTKILDLNGFGPPPEGEDQAVTGEATASTQSTR